MLLLQRTQHSHREIHKSVITAPGALRPLLTSKGTYLPWFTHSHGICPKMKRHRDVQIAGLVAVLMHSHPFCHTRTDQDGSGWRHFPGIHFCQFLLTTVNSCVQTGKHCTRWVSFWGVDGWVSSGRAQVEGARGGEAVGTEIGM